MRVIESLRAKPRLSAAVAVSAALLAVSGLALRARMQAKAHGAEAAAAVSYQCPMHAWVKDSRRSRCTICGMDLAPAAAPSPATASAPAQESGIVVSLSPSAITVLNVQSEPVGRRALERVLRVAGTIEAPDSSRAVVSAPSGGRIAALNVDYAGVEVAAGQKLMSLLSPDLAQKRRYLRYQAGQSSPAGKADEAMLNAMVYEPSSSGDILAQQAGTVIERNVSLGQYVAEGERLLTIVDLSVLWFRFDVYESQLPWVRLGQRVEVRFASLPGMMFPARVSFIEPVLADATRTFKVRAELSNPVRTSQGARRRLLQLGMYGEGRVISRTDRALALPRTAVLFPGSAAYVYVDKGAGSYERRRIRVGRQGDAHWEVLKGLKEGERVVTAGNVLLDSQAQLSQGDQLQEGEVQDEPQAETMYAAEPRAMAEADPHAGAGHAGMVMKAAVSVPRFKGMDEEMDAPPVQAAGTTSLTAVQRNAVEAFLAQADELALALAENDLTRFNRVAVSLPDSLPTLLTEFRAGHRWQSRVSAVAAASRFGAATDLALARERFLPFTAAMVPWALELRADDAVFSGLKVYRSPRAPEPGSWVQRQGPGRNPFFGSEAPGPEKDFEL
ncbi:MAG: efflux RND transporter periplasmic adaptor subunit [Elusimicrobiota bacterium]|jgi:Cu(I)/Ag(I) efflux system membrane fusion protein